MNNSIVLDTNLLLDDPKIISTTFEDYSEIVIPLTVLKELDKHKFNPDLAYSARSAIREIKKELSKGSNIILQLDTDTDLSTNDLKIINAAKSSNSDLATKDIAMSVIAESFGVNTKVYDFMYDRLHDSYTFVDLITLSNLGFTFKNIYDLSKSKDCLYLLSEAADKSKLVDCGAWSYFIISSDSCTIDYVYVLNPISNLLYRVDTSDTYRILNIHNTDSVVAKDYNQVCAIHSLIESPNILITGKWGSGKSLLTTAFVVSKQANMDRKIYITRPPVGINKKYDIGLLPGEAEDKMMGWFAGILSSLYYIYGNTMGQSKGNASFDWVKDEIFKKKFKVIPINSIQGLSLLPGDILLVDECQLLPIEYLSMILSRGCEGSKIILLGDIEQTYDVVRPSESGLLKLLRLLPHTYLSHVDLKVSYRSKLTELADMMSNNLI